MHQKKQKPEQRMFKDSKVVLFEEQDRNIQGFFLSNNQMIKNVTLIFRASEYEFLAQQFHLKSNNQEQTITICENEYGKKFGGYASMKWNSKAQDQWGLGFVKDPTGKQFIFSLSNNHKFTQSSSADYSIRCYQPYGPVFGGDHRGFDLRIADRCHEKSDSGCNVNRSYTNPNYKQNDQQSRTLMTGNPSRCDFKVKQYEVWKVEFMS